MDIKLLKQQFYHDYCQEKYPCILTKETRGYSMIILKISNAVTFGIPIKSNLANPKCGFVFAESGRKVDDEIPGLDFMSSIVITKKEYIGNNAPIDKIEQSYIIKNEKKIYQEYKKYVTGYIKYVKSPISNYYSDWRYSHCALKYFWKELGIKETEEAKEKVLLAHNIYLVINHIRKHTYTDYRDYYVRTTNGSVSISFASRFIIKDMTNNNIKDYYIEKFSYDDKKEIKRLLMPGIKMKEIIQHVISLKDTSRDFL